MTMEQVMFSFKGKLSRTDFWKGMSIVLPIAILNSVVFYRNTQFLRAENPGALAVSRIIGVIVFWMAMSLIVKRLRDRNHKSLFSLLIFIPVINIWPLIEAWFLRKKSGSEPTDKISIRSSKWFILRIFLIVATFYLASKLINARSIGFNSQLFLSVSKFDEHGDWYSGGGTGFLCWGHRIPKNHTFAVSPDSMQRNHTVEDRFPNGYFSKLKKDLNSQIVYELQLDCISGGQLKELSPLTKLKSLELSSSPSILDPDIALLAGFTNLTKLELSYMDSITDEGLHHLENLTNLQELSFKECQKITNERILWLCEKTGAVDTSPRISEDNGNTILVAEAIESPNAMESLMPYIHIAIGSVIVICIILLPLRGNRAKHNM